MDWVGATLDKLAQWEMKTLAFFLGKSVEEPRDTQLDLEGASTTLTRDQLDPKMSPLYWTFHQMSREDPLEERGKDLRGQVISPRSTMISNSTFPLMEIEVLSGMNLKRQHENDGSILECYKMDQSRKAFVMCMKNGRPGAEQDLNLITNWLEKCKFKNTSCIDPNEAELTKQLKKFRDGIKDDVSCCLVTLMAHGGKGFIKTKMNERVNLSDIFEMFNNENCPALQEKPKIFVIQACRGDQRDGGVVVTDDEPMDLDYSEKKRLPTFSDYYTIYSTQEDYVSLRHPKDGSVMIQAINEVFEQHGMKWHIADFFTQVNNRVVHTEYYMGKDPIKVVLVMESTLTKAVFF